MGYTFSVVLGTLYFLEVQANLEVPMPWLKEKPMDKKILFLGEYLLQSFSFSELCSRFGISRKTGYKWINRYNESGNAESLKDLSRRPHHSPTQTSAEIVKALLSIRDKHPFWGPKKLLWRIERDHPQWKDLPARSTVALILKRNDYIKPPRKRSRRYHPGQPLSEMSQPNDVWTADFKGHFKTQDGLYCYPLTICDGYSRYLFACRGMISPLLTNVYTVFRQLFSVYGLPKIIRTDNGLPFASNALGRFSRLSVWWMRLGIIPEQIEPGCPQQNGRHERMHRTLKQETTIPAADNLKRQQKRFNHFKSEYNTIRPHEALDMKVPAEVYKPSQKPLPKKVPQVEYPDHFEVRRVSNNSGIRWKCKRINVGTVFSGQYVGLEEIDNGLWDVYFGNVWLGRLDEKLMQIIDKLGRTQREKYTRKV